METPFHHALKILEDVCIGCSHCMKMCPTAAIRIRNGKSTLMPNRCVDCGECYRVCPVHAIIVEQDDFRQVFNYEYRIALVPSVFFGQFPEKYSIRDIYSVLMDLGFTNIVELEHSADLLIDVMKHYMKQPDIEKPVISSFCPAIVRLIQVKFPSLTDHLVQLKTPVDISALYYKKRLINLGIPEEKIGIFYITPCAAKIAAAKSPVAETSSDITGVINMDFLYNKTLRALKNSGKQDETHSDEGIKFLSSRSVRWSLTHGESENFEGRCLAIDEIHNVIQFLEKIENDEVQGVDFLELRACDESCPNGILVTENSFLTVERLRKRAKEYETLEHHKDHQLRMMRLNVDVNKAMEAIHTGEVKPRSMHSLDDDMETAFRKMNEIQDLMKLFPEVDCGLCGAPTCEAHAEDVVQNKSNINRCVFVQNDDKRKNPLDELVKVWGDKVLRIESKSKTDEL
ncbi:MAG: [Fe-Fe] hydrogenase large subunit C-terminal domain-containing protein [Bacteroidales bacterium]|nr:[Fe-Fe] hydrogenase large subunit C-terminal domain-containing protein [Bacteroidales bacterium]